MATFTFTLVYTVSGTDSDQARNHLAEWMRSDRAMHGVRLQFESVRMDTPDGADEASWGRVIRDQLLGPKSAPQPAWKKSQS